MTTIAVRRRNVRRFVRRRLYAFPLHVAVIAPDFTLLDFLPQCHRAIRVPSALPHVHFLSASDVVEGQDVGVAGAAVGAGNGFFVPAQTGVEREALDLAPTVMHGSPVVREAAVEVPDGSDGFIHLSSLPGKVYPIQERFEKEAYG